MLGEKDTRALRPARDAPTGVSVRPLYDRSWAVIVGISAYEPGSYHLPNARRDAEEMARVLRESFGFDEVHTLYDQEASDGEILSWLRDRLPHETHENDRVVFFFAGHGATQPGEEEGTKRGYLVPHNARVGQYADYVDMRELRDACALIPAKHILVILDTCFSGIAAVATRDEPQRSGAPLSDAYLRRITTGRARQVLTAGRSDERAADSGVRPGHSAFTGALLDALEGRADQNCDGLITAVDLASYVCPRVSRETAVAGEAGQTPFFGRLDVRGEGDFVFLLPGAEGPLAGAAESEARLERLSDLDQAYREWQARKHLAGRSQLQKLMETGGAATASPVQALFLLRSAVQRDLPPGPWLDLLCARGQIGEIEIPADSARAELASEAQQLLGLKDERLPERPAAGDKRFGPVAWAAVHHSDARLRHTAALALLTLQPAPLAALGRLRAALRHSVQGPLRRWGRRAELLGTLAEADPRVGDELVDLGLPVRAGIGLWRAGSRLRRDSGRIMVMAAGGALGAGVGLGLLRSLTTLLIGVPTFVQLSFTASVSGGLLAGSLVLGLAASLALLRPASPASGRSTWRRQALVLSLGALTFSVGHALVAFLGGLSLAAAPWFLPMGFLFGLGLGLAVVDRLGDGQSRTRGAWLWRTGLAAAVSVLIQALYLLAGGQFTAIGLLWPGRLYSDWLGLSGEGSWADSLSLLDAALVGAVLAAALAFGLDRAGRWLARYRDMASRAGE
jgi:hypothetical protein